MKARIAIAVTMIVMAGVLAGCGDKPLPTRKINGVVRVMMHEEDKYTLFVRMPKSKKLKQITLDYISKIVMFEDVPVDKEMWVVVKSHKQSFENNPIIDLLEIHLHEASEINGAGWNHGKLGHGRTIVIE